MANPTYYSRKFVRSPGKRPSKVMLEKAVGVLVDLAADFGAHDYKAFITGKKTDKDIADKKYTRVYNSLLRMKKFIRNSL